jgi:hypothetical protein
MFRSEALAARGTSSLNGIVAVRLSRRTRAGFWLSVIAVATLSLIAANARMSLVATATARYQSGRRSMPATGLLPQATVIADFPQELEKHMPTGSSVLWVFEHVAFEAPSTTAVVRDSGGTWLRVCAAAPSDVDEVQMKAGALGRAEFPLATPTLAEALFKKR